MSNVSLQSVSSSAWANNASAHYSIPTLPWFKSSGASSSYPTAFTPDLGDTTRFESNVNANNYAYIFDKTDPFWPNESSNDFGFSVRKASTPETVEFNYRISGGNGLWMPCPIFRSISFYWKNKFNQNSNFRPRRLALTVRNRTTGMEKTWSPGWDSSHNPNAVGQVYIFNGAAKSDEVRNLGPDWYIHGVIFNFRSNGTSGSQAPESVLSDFRLGYHVGSGASTKMIVPKNQSWNDLLSLYAAGEVGYS